MSDWFDYKWTLRSYTACQTGGEIDKVSWYSFSWWIGVVTTESGQRTSWVCVSGQVEYSSVADNTLEVRRHFCLGWCWSGAPSPLSRTESNWPLAMTTFWIITGFAEALVTVQSPSSPRRWQHWVTERDLAASTPVARWLVLSQTWWFLLSRFQQTVFWLCFKKLLVSNFKTAMRFKIN